MMNPSSATSRTFFFAYIPPSIQLIIKAGAFEALCRHLEERSREVSNIDMMAVTGFCRNCLAKWLVLGARRLSTKLAIEERDFKDNRVQLDAFGYDEAAAYIYGCGYAEWKKQYQTNATEAQLVAYESSKSIHAKHDAILMDPLYHERNVDTNQKISFSSFSTEIQKQLQADAFDSICEHLQQQSQYVTNIAMMTVAGFCRNCLAKWLVLEARKISAAGKQHLPALDAFGYEDAAEVVYGCSYSDWKARYRVDATDEQMSAYRRSSHMHATHDEILLKERSAKTNLIPIDQKNDGGKTASNRILSSNVCCQDVDSLLENATTAYCEKEVLSPSKSHSDLNLVPPPKDGVTLRVGVLTVSDRCFSKQYESGDLSGPAVVQAVQSTVEKLNSLSSSSRLVSVDLVQRGIVPDEQLVISKTLQTWSKQCNLIFTTGGTGFSPRDLTPEATAMILEKECRGLMTWASMECSSTQPLASLSRGTAGICGNCIIVNLPGTPAGAAQVTTVLLPLLIHAVKDVTTAL